MPIKITAKNGDCLCAIAVDNGFVDCQPLRDLAENSEFTSRALRAGDEVTVPDLVKEDFSKGVDTRHPFRIKSSPPFYIRFVHGSADLPYKDDADVNTLHVSNFVTNLGGDTGLRPFPTGYGYHADGHADLDAFKVEVWDPSAGGGPVNVKLEALKPVYTADAESGAMKVTSYAEFTEAGRKIDALACNQVSGSSPNTYRSKYLRLVVDEADRDCAEVPGQVLYVSDVADGLGTGAATDNDTVEILDQTVRATYEIARCPGTPKCKVTKTADIGGTERQRVRVHFYAFRNAVGNDTMPTGVTAAVVKKHLRRRMFKWYRRVFAQADLAPKLVSLNIVDPPAENMLCLSHSHGRPVATTGTVQIDFRIKTATQDVPVQVVFAGGETPVEAGSRILAGLPAGFGGEALACTRATNALNPACDVLITSGTGERITLLDVQLTVGAGMTVAVPRIDMNSVLADDADVDASLAFLTIDFKRILRAIPVTDDAMHCIVVGTFNRRTTRGQAFLDCSGADEPYRPDRPFRSATIMAHTSSTGAVLDDSDNLPFTSPHESVHTLCDLIHTKPSTDHSRTQLMGSGTSAVNAVGASKRLCDGPYLVHMQRNETTTQTIVQVKLAESIRTTGAAKLEAW